jgi:membrane-bound inhibitor of C-type lysozyme
MTDICKTISLIIAASAAMMSTSHATEGNYVCGDGSKITAEFSSPDKSPGDVTLSIDGSPDLIVLPQALSADGGRYQKDDIEFWIKGRDATLTRQGNSTICKGE